MTDEERARAESVLERRGVFKGADGLQRLAECDKFWDRQSYGTRLYFGAGIADYLHRSILRAAVEALDAQDAALAAALAAKERETVARMEKNCEARLAAERERYGELRAVAEELTQMRTDAPGFVREFTMLVMRAEAAIRALGGEG